LILLTGCIDPYTPPAIEQEAAILVIDGFINITGESTIRLSRSQNISDTNIPLAESNALISVEDEAGTKVFLTEAEAGKYILPQQTFTSNNYRLNILTKDLKEYQSSFEPILVSPSIDSLTWNLTDNLGVQVNVNTHEFEKPKGFYRWTFEETWLYTSKYQSFFMYNYDTRKVELRPDNIFECYRSASSTDILIESTIRLSQNEIPNFPITYIPNNSERLRYQYSIIATQYSITEDAFSYWQQLKKTTEDLGTLFGPLPSQVTGNFQCISNPSEPVIGYFAIGNAATKRIFISANQLLGPPVYDTPYENCEASQLLNANIPNFGGPYLITSGIPNPAGPGIIGYYYSTPRCVDCRETGGITTKPDFWQ
jgi:hypothetical protein